MSSMTTPTRGERASPKPSTTQQRVDEVLRRKAEAEKRVNERREALKQEQMNKLEKINAFREQERRERMRKNAEKELIRQKEALDRRQAQLEENQKKKEAILAKAHAATSRTANKENTKKSFAFGSSTPRELAYLQTLSKEAKVYDKKLKPEPLSPTRLRPSAASAASAASTPNAMTTSVYVFSAPREARPSPRVMSRIRSSATSSAPTNHTGGMGGGMTQSMHVSSSSAFPHSQPRPPLPPRASRGLTGPTPTRAPRPTVTATERKRDPPSRRPPSASSQSPSGRPLRSRGGVSGAAGRNTLPVAPSPLTVATNQEVSSSSSLHVENTPPAPPSEDSDAGFSEGSYERAGSEKSTPVHGVEQTIEEELTPREEQPAVAIAAAFTEETAAEVVEEKEKKEEEAVVEKREEVEKTPLVEEPTEMVLTPPTSLPTASVEEVVELDYSAPLLDLVQTPVVEAHLIEDEKKEQTDLPEEKEQEKAHQSTVLLEEEPLPTVPQEVPAPHEDIVPQVVEEPVGSEEEKDTVAPVVTVAEERNLLVDFSESTVDERSEEEDKTPLVEEVTPIGERGRSLADELGDLMRGEKKEEEKEESLIQIEKMNGVPSLPYPSLVEDTVVNSLADELAQALGGVVEKKEEEVKRESAPPPSSSSPTPSSHEEGPTLSAHPSSSSLPSGSSSGTESGESSPNTRRRRTEEKKAEMMKQSTILAMADSAAKERDERKARLAAIMNRTRAGGATPATGAAPAATPSGMTSSMTGESSASSVLAKIAHITSNPRIMQVAEKTGSSSDLRMGELPGAVPQY